MPQAGRFLVAPPGAGAASMVARDARVCVWGPHEPQTLQVPLKQSLRLVRAPTHARARVSAHATMTPAQRNGSRYARCVRWPARVLRRGPARRCRRGCAHGVPDEHHARSGRVRLGRGGRGLDVLGRGHGVGGGARRGGGGPRARARATDARGTRAVPEDDGAGAAGSGGGGGGGGALPNRRCWQRPHARLGDDCGPLGPRKRGRASRPGGAGLRSKRRRPRQRHHESGGASFSKTARARAGRAPGGGGAGRAG